MKLVGRESKDYNDFMDLQFAHGSHPKLLILHLPKIDGALKCPPTRPTTWRYMGTIRCIAQPVFTFVYLKF